MATSNSPLRRRGLIAFSLLTLALAGVVGIGLWHVVELSSLARVGAQVARLGVLASVVRGVLIAGFALCWPRLLAYMQHRGWITASQRSVLLASRWRIVVWLLIIELLLGQHLVNRFVSAWGAGA